MEGFLREVLAEIEKVRHVQIQLDFQEGYPPVENDFDAAWIVKESAQECLGRKHVHVIRGPLVGSDDMAFFLENTPGCYFWWGIAPQDGSGVSAHTPTFDFRNEALIPAVDVMISAVERALVHFADREREEI